MEKIDINDYILSHSDDEGALLAALNRDANVNLLRPRMLSGHLQGRILKMFCRMLRPKRALEIGTYTAYATLCMAEGMEEGSLIHTAIPSRSMMKWKISSRNMYLSHRIKTR